MQYFPLRTTQPKRVHKITRDRLLDAMKSGGLRPGKGRKFAVAYPIAKGQEKVKVCSPKDVIRLAVRNRKAKFSGGTQTNEVFKSLGFPVGKTKTVQERTEREPFTSQGDYISQSFIRLENLILSDSFCSDLNRKL